MTQPKPPSVPSVAEAMDGKKTTGDKLEPCPWITCGASGNCIFVRCEYLTPQENLYEVICDVCGATGPDADNKGEAIRLWNTRTRPSRTDHGGGD